MQTKRTGVSSPARQQLAHEKNLAAHTLQRSIAPVGPPRMALAHEQPRSSTVAGMSSAIQPFPRSGVRGLPVRPPAKAPTAHAWAAVSVPSLSRLQSPGVQRYAGGSTAPARMILRHETPAFRLANVSTRAHGGSISPALQRKVALMSSAGKGGTVVQRYGANPLGDVGGVYVPVLATPVAGHAGGIAYAMATFGRPVWDPATVNFMWNGAGSVRRAVNLTHPTTGAHLGAALQYVCGACGDWGFAGEMQIGHNTEWGTFVANTMPADTAEAVWAYQDLRNLRMEHAVCNASHDFESKKDPEPPHRDDDDDFIDNSKSNPKQDALAFKMLRAHLHGTTQYSLVK